MPRADVLVLFSGGQDSATCLFHALKRYDRVATMGFDYGQRHTAELACRRNILDMLPRCFPELAAKLLPDTLLDVRPFGSLATNALTGGGAVRTGENGLPTTFVPGRNLLFCCCAAARAYALDCGVIVAGVGQNDYSGYPDCREDTMLALERALCLGLDREIRIETPLMHMTKAQTWALAEEIGGAALVAFILEHSHTCYLNDRSHRHAWGYGCGSCPACELRAAGWRQYAAGRF